MSVTPVLHVLPAHTHTHSQTVAEIECEREREKAGHVAEFVAYFLACADTK